MKLNQTDILRVHTQVIHLRMKMMIITTKLRKLPNLLKLKQLSNQAKTQLKKKRKQNALKIPESSYSEFFTGQIQNPNLELQQQISEFRSSEQTKVEKGRLGLQKQRTIEAAENLYKSKNWNGIICYNI